MGRAFGHNRVVIHVSRAFWVRSAGPGVRFVSMGRFRKCLRVHGFSSVCLAHVGHAYA